MCHESVIAWAATTLGADLVAGRTVVEVGACNVNGSVREGIEAHGPVSYLGVDIADGPGVDLVADVVDLPGWFPEGFGLVVCTEMLEHVLDWRVALWALVELVAPGGTLAISTRSPGFPYHPYPVDLWRYPPDLLGGILTGFGLDVVSCDPDPEQAGVFAVAHKPAAWLEPSLGWLDLVEVPGV